MVPTTPLDDPTSLFHGIEIWYLRTLDACAAVSGYGFRTGSTATAPQLHAMCANSDCIELLNMHLSAYIFASSVQGGTDEAFFMPGLRHFATPMFEYCSFFHVPNDPCPSDPLKQLLVDMKPITEACETQSKVSIQAVVQGANDLTQAMCDVPACDNLLRRVFLKLMLTMCPYGNRADVKNRLVDPYKTLCKARERVAWYTSIHLDAAFEYSYLPGPLPLAPNYVVPPAPPVPPSTTTRSPPSLTPTTATSTMTTTTQQPAGGVTAQLPETQKDANAPKSSTSTSTMPPSSRPTSDAQQPLVDTRMSSGSLGEEELTPAGGAAAGTLGRPPRTRTNSTRSTAAGVVDQDGPAKTTLLQDAGGSDGAALQSALIVAAVVVALVLSVVMHRRRHRRVLAHKTADASSVDTGSAYQTLEGGSPRDALADSWSVQHACLATCTELPVSQLHDLRILGGGGFGVVYLVRDTQHDRLLASKRLARTHPHATADELNAFVAEINLAASLSHERIVTFVGVAGLHKSALQALFEYMDGGDLKQYLDQRPRAASWTPEKLQIAVDVADALAYLHSLTPSPVVHRDLKSRNVLLAHDKRAKLGDFGISRAESVVGSMTTGVGTSRWVAPEVILGGGSYTSACDIYSYGAVLSELDTHRVPFAELTHANGEPLADFAVLELVATQRQQPAFTETCPPRMLTLAQKCLAFEPQERPSAVEIAAALRVIQQELDTN